MAYKVINKFIDKQEKREYEAGDDYPAEGAKEPSEKRIKELSQKHPKHKRAFIEEVVEPANAPDPGKQDKEPDEEPSKDLDPEKEKKQQEEPTDKKQGKKEKPSSKK